MVKIVDHFYESEPNNVTGWIGARRWDKLMVTTNRNFWWKQLWMLGELT